MQLPWEQSSYKRTKVKKKKVVKKKPKAKAKAKVAKKKGTPGPRPRPARTKEAIKKALSTRTRTGEECDRILKRKLTAHAGHRQHKKGKRLPVISEATRLSGGAGAKCYRSPCGPPRDPKVTDLMIKAALKNVGKPKGKRRPYITKSSPPQIKRHPATSRPTRPGASKGWPLTVACGIGVDSVSILVGLVQLHKKHPRGGFKPDLITFADTGGEHPETYAYLGPLNQYLAKNGFPLVTVVAWSTEMLPASRKDKAGWGTGLTLEITSINSHTVPSISTGGHNCSDKFKIQPQSSYLKWFYTQKASRDLAVKAGLIRSDEADLLFNKLQIPSNFDDALVLLGVVPKSWRAKHRQQVKKAVAKQRIVRAIGYDATEENRLVKGGTYSARKEAEDRTFEGWFPLIEWGWDRSRCIAEIAVAMGSRRNPAWTLVPRKSSCFFCGAMKPEEILLLYETGHVDLLERALFMEQVAILGRHPLRTASGLGRSFAWSDFATANLEGLGARQSVLITGGIIYPRKNKHGTVSWWNVYEGDPRGYDPSTEHRPAVLASNQKEWRYYKPDSRFPIVTPKRLHQIKRLACQWIEASPKKKGRLDHDLVFHPIVEKIPAFEILGFRGTDIPVLDRLPDVLMPRYGKRIDEGHKETPPAALYGLEDAWNRIIRKRWKPKGKRVKRNPGGLTVGMLLAGGLAAPRPGRRI